MFHRNREDAERRRIKRQNKVYNQLMDKPYFRRMAEKSRSKTLEHRAASVETWAMASGMFIAGFLVAENLDRFASPNIALAAVVFASITSLLSTARYVIESTVLAVDLRTHEQGATAQAGDASPAADVVAA
jgi:hypothetical protein